MNKHIFAWDLGATKCTAGIIEYDVETQALTCSRHFTVKLKHTTSLEDLIIQLEVGLDCRMKDADAVCIGAAGQYDGEYLLLEGVYPYSMPFAKLAMLQKWPAYVVIHDYAPIVCATFTSYVAEATNIKKLNVANMNPYGRRVAMGIGTGLGLKDGVLLPDGDFWLGKNEMGHIGVSTPPLANKFHLKRHHELMKYLQDQSHQLSNQSITFERILSGKGTVRLFDFFYPHSTIKTPEEVGSEMRSGKATEMLDAFAWYLGLYVGTVQLSFMPEGGIWITGGVAIKHSDVFYRPEFFDGIKASPAYLLQREEYPLTVMCNNLHALIGAGYYASKRLLI
jgi:glucokinase